MKFSVYLCFLPFTLSVYSSLYRMPFHSNVSVPASRLLLEIKQTPNLFFICEHRIFIWKILKVMKFSVFLCFLSFNLSVYSSPYKMSFHSNVSIPPHRLLPQLTQTPNLFLIRGHGIFVWKILEVENFYQKPNENFPYYSNTYKARLANQLSMFSPAKIERVSLKLSYSNLIELKLNSNETYILLKVKSNNEWVAFYWIGKESRLARRQLTARLVVRMMYELDKQIKGAKLLHLSREEENKESEEFQDFFCGSNSIRDSRLFKVTGESGQFIIEVPLKYNELNSDGVFVLDKKIIILIWNAIPVKRILRNKALALARHIEKFERPTLNIQFMFAKTSNENEFRRFQREFLNVIDGTPSSMELPKKPSLMITDEQLQVQRNGQLRLFEYSIIDNRVVSKEINTRPLTLAHFEPNNTYVMIDSYAGSIFVYIGENAHYVQIEQAMAAAEIIYWRSAEYEWLKVTVIRHVDMLPTHFIINFPEIRNILRNYIIRY